MLSTIKSLSISVCLLLHQTEIAKRLNTICAQVIPFLSQEVSMCDLELQTVLCIPFIHSNFTGKSAIFVLQHQQQVVQAVERAKQVTMAELNAVIGVRGLPGLPPTVCIPLISLCINYRSVCVYSIGNISFPTQTSLEHS